MFGLQSLYDWIYNWIFDSLQTSMVFQNSFPQLESMRKYDLDVSWIEFSDEKNEISDSG